MVMALHWIRSVNGSFSSHAGDADDAGDAEDAGEGDSGASATRAADIASRQTCACEGNISGTGAIED
tara:strand:- start:74 stop:274 length:201 start_codon:yes stop_codon:yes gene_type:complete